MESTTVQSALRDGAAFRESVRDGREVYVGGRRVEDVTSEPTLGPGIDLMAEMFDAQFDPATREQTTYWDEGLGTEVSRAWQAPTTPEELRARRAMIEYTARKTVGTFGRPPDLGSTIGIGLLAYKPLFEEVESDFGHDNAAFAENVERYIEHARRNNIIVAEVLSDPQADRSLKATEHPGLLKVVEKRDDGVILRGAKSVGSLGAQADEILFTNFARPDAPPEAFIWAAVPVNAPGLRLVCREGVGHPGSDPYDHPIASRGEEADQLLIFDEVYIPNERIFNLGDDGQDNRWLKVLWAHWHILTRLWVKARIFAGAGQAVVDALGTGSIPAVRAMVGDLMEFEQSLKAFLLACENVAEPCEVGIMAPDANLMTAGRLYAVRSYPRIIHTLQELCGQGLVMRFPKAAFDHPEIGARLEELLPGHQITARDKNRLMNFVWDLTSSSHAGRTELFENVNATPAPLLRDRLYGDYDGAHAVGMARELAGIA